MNNFNFIIINSFRSRRIFISKRIDKFFVAIRIHIQYWKILKLENLQPSENTEKYWY